MLTWILLFVATVVVAFIAAYLLLRPTEYSSDNVVELAPHERNKKVG